MDADKIISIIHKYVVPALGCTEPIAVALASAEARRALGCEPDAVEVYVSGNILKNAMGVGIPGTGLSGLPIAAALGALGGDPDRGLEVLESASREDVAKASEFVSAGNVSVATKEDVELLYVEVIAKQGDDSASATIKNSHANIVRIERNGEILHDTDVNEDTAVSEEDCDPRELTVREIVDFATSAPLDTLRFILDAHEMNSALANEGIQKRYGLGLGRKVAEQADRGLVSHGMMIDAVIAATAAVDARMAGSEMPAMSNSGSGNQGITATLPVSIAAEKLGKPEEELIRAQIISHLTAIYIKSYLGPLSALCGVVVAATGASAGIVYLLGGSYTEITHAINNMTGNITGMICDGAKPGCAFKVSTGVVAAFEAAFLAVDGISVSGLDGIVEDDIEKTIRNLAEIGSDGMKETDTMIQRIMMCK